ncbi:MAG: hypothetical protein JWM61_3315 [Micrococcaceae bacterium]|jgi:hypothetical protein|nr:hypothetical protein [Micrococcaceae bacterium]
MTESPEHLSNQGTRTDGDARQVRPPMPRWVKIFLAVVLVIVAALLISRALGVQHGPGMHGASASAAAMADPRQQCLALYSWPVTFFLAGKSYLLASL